MKKHITNDGLSVETWYDRASRNYLTQIKDPEGNQIGSAFWAGNKTTAAFNHKEAIEIATWLPHLDSLKLPTKQ